MDGKTQLYRQIHPQFVKEGRATSQAFRPSSDDPCRMSADDSSRITAENAWRQFTSQFHNESYGVMAVTADECRSMDLKVDPDYVPYPSHVSIHFDASGRSKKAVSKYLRAAASSRGWIFSPGNA